MKAYHPQYIETKWQKEWNRSGYPKPKTAQQKYYILDMFPYPSGDGLHVGHVENYTATDILARFMRMNGYAVMHPIGWDAFGLPAENFAIKTGVHPEKKKHENIKKFTRQIKHLGLSYDWEREIDTSSPEYYRWTQWMFLFLYKNGLAYKKKARVNWCPSCQTVLANEQVVEGKCERCKSEVVQKDLEQWFFKITDFVEDTRSQTGKKIPGLLSGLKKVDWPNSTKAAQENWIGRSEGAVIKFPVVIPSEASPKAGEVEESQSRSSRRFAPQDDTYIEVFTTRLDTIFGCTYVVIAPENPLVVSLLNDKFQISNFKNKGEVNKYFEKTQKKTDLERTELNKEKTGVKLEGLEAINPFTGETVPIFVADYVLGSYGTGAVMAVPAHDTRDWEFAKKYNIPIKKVVSFSDNENQKSKIKNQNYNSKIKNLEDVFIDDGILVDSGEFSGLTSAEAREKMTVWLEKKKLGNKKVNYRLRDWLISRQRYWGAPIPIIYCEHCGMVPVSEKDLPVKLPKDVDFRPTGESPLTRSKSFHKVKCPICGVKARRESDTLDTFVCSSWYYLRFADPNNTKKFADQKKLEKYLPVDFYMGGAEHTVLHLLYARFFTKALAKYGYLNFAEPFLKLRHQGMVLAEDGRKMSKSLGNVVNPDDVVAEFGADTLRLYEMFMGPLEDMKAWNTESIIGLRRFLEKVWKLNSKLKTQNLKLQVKNERLDSFVHQTIKKVTEDIENLKFNTAISSLMILVNAMEKKHHLSLITYQSLLLLLSPFAPHIAEELWFQLGNKKSIFLETWPEWDKKKIVLDTVNVAVQVNGKVRAVLTAEAGANEESVKSLALQDEKVAARLSGKEIVRVIYVQDKILNFVVK
jgi:leucyl-tRNA synthetase